MYMPCLKLSPARLLPLPVDDKPPAGLPAAINCCCELKPGPSFTLLRFLGKDEDRDELEPLVEGSRSPNVPPEDRVDVFFRLDLRGTAMGAGVIDKATSAADGVGVDSRSSEGSVMVAKLEALSDLPPFSAPSRERFVPFELEPPGVSGLFDVGDVGPEVEPSLLRPERWRLPLLPARFGGGVAPPVGRSSPRIVAMERDR